MENESSARTGLGATRGAVFWRPGASTASIARSRGTHFGLATASSSFPGVGQFDCLPWASS